MTQDGRLDRRTNFALIAMGLAVLIVANDFTALSVALPAIERDLDVLIACRALMGIGGAMMWPAILGMTYEVLPESKAGLAGGLILGRRRWPSAAWSSRCWSWAAGCQPTRCGCTGRTSTEHTADQTCVQLSRL